MEGTSNTHMYTSKSYPTQPIDSLIIEGSSQPLEESITIPLSAFSSTPDLHLLLKPKKIGLRYVNTLQECLIVIITNLQPLTIIMK